MAGVRYMNELRAITVESYVEHSLAHTLNLVDGSLASASVELSLDWLADRRAREKVFFDLSRVTNCKGISTTLQFCLQTVI